MRSFFRTTLTHASAVALIALTGTVGCGGDSSTEIPEEDTGVEETIEDTGELDTAVDMDSGADSEMDTLVEDTSGGDTTAGDTTIDDTSAGDTSGGDTGAADTATADTAVADTATSDTATSDTAVAETAADTATTDTATADTAAAETAADTAPACTVGTLCADKTLCTAAGDAGPTCTPCTVGAAGDTACAAAASGTLCIPSTAGGTTGTCEVAACHPTTPSAAGGCATAGSLCCKTSTSAGACIAPVTGKTLCCADADCGTTGMVCNLATNTCACPAPTAGDYHVSNAGSDTTGNGSATCPFKTITKAIDTAVASSAAIATTITLHHGTGVATFGTGCGTGTCDTTPIALPSTLTGGVTIKGDATMADVKVASSATASSVFTVNTKASFDSLTINPTMTSTSANAGAHGIVYFTTAPAAQGSITNVLISGASGAASTGSAISILGPASPTIGPNVQLMNGYHGILVQGVGANPVVTGAASKQVVVSGFTNACVNVFSDSATGAPAITMSSGAGATTNEVVVKDCGTAAIVVNTASSGTGSSFDHINVTRSTTGGAYLGLNVIRAGKASISNSLVGGLLDAGIVANDTANVTITGTTSSGNTGANADGIRCQANSTIKVRTSTTLQNAGNGVFVTDNCVADLGATSGDIGSNVFNKTTLKNAKSGLCFLSSAGAVTASSSTWSCNYVQVLPTDPACVTTSAPTTAAPTGGGTNCRNGFDITVPAGSTVARPLPTCCAL